jgi:hypothetical protein
MYTPIEGGVERRGYSQRGYTIIDLYLFLVGEVSLCRLHDHVIVRAGVALPRELVNSTIDIYYSKPTC